MPVDFLVTTYLFQNGVYSPTGHILFFYTCLIYIVLIKSWIEYLDSFFHLSIFSKSCFCLTESPLKGKTIALLTGYLIQIIVHHPLS